MLLNVKAVKEEALENSKRFKGGKFTQVSKHFIEEVEEDVRMLIYRKVMSHPSKGKTIMGIRGD
jgi:hypothetical protein